MQNICIAGDLNREFIRANYKHTITLHIFIVCKTQCSTLLHDYAEIVCTFSNMSIDFLFTLDHVIVSPKLYDSMFSYYSLCDWVENQSDYCCLISNFFVMLIGATSMFMRISHANGLIKINLFLIKHC